MIFSPFFLFALDIFPPPKRFFFSPSRFLFPIKFQEFFAWLKLCWGKILLRSFNEFFRLFVVLDVSYYEAKKTGKKKWIKKNPYPSFRFNFERTIYLQLVGKSILLFIYLLKLIPNLKSGIQSEFFFLYLFFFLSMSFFIISCKKIS